VTEGKLTVVSRQIEVTFFVLCNLDPAAGYADKLIVLDEGIILYAR